MKGLRHGSHYPRETAIRIDCNQLGSIPNTNLGLPATVALGHLWYNSGPHFMGLPNASQLGTTSCQDVLARPALRLTSGSPYILTTI